jgi:hypothetical protein
MWDPNELATVSLEIHRWNRIVAHLGKKAYEEVFDLIGPITEQTSTQHQAKEDRIKQALSLAAQPPRSNSEDRPPAN